MSIADAIREVGGNLVFYDSTGREIFTLDRENRRISVAPNATLVTPGDIEATDIADGAVDTDQLADAAVTTDKIADTNVTTDKLAEGGVTKTKLGEGTYKVVTTVVDVSAGGSAQTTAIATIPALSVVTEVHLRVTEDFDGDTTQDLAVGVSGTPAKYLASADFETGADDIDSGDEAFASALGSPTVPVSLVSGEAIIATWTNDGSASAGSVRVSVTYYTEDAA